MTQWYVKDLSKLVGVSVQTLHHYDRIGLLKPSVRLASGYRLYSEKDLMKLQQIVALKFFGFELSRIKKLMAGDMDPLQHLRTQAHFLEGKAKGLLNASQALQKITSEYGDIKSIPWEKIIQLIEVYQMTKELEQTWAGKVFTADELKQYARFESELKTRFTEDQKKDFEKTWAAFVAEVGSHLDQDPTGDYGYQMAKQVMDLINNLYGREHANLKHAVWNRGFKQGQVDEEHAVSPEIVNWLDKAMDTYYRKRIYAILDQIEEKGDVEDIATQWDALMDEMYGNAENLKNELIEIALKEGRVGKTAKKWLESKKG
jgi:DNA-binding transcriptional MerR regulator